MFDQMPYLLDMRNKMSIQVIHIVHLDKVYKH